MSRLQTCLRAALLAAVIAVPVASTGCAVRARVYDPYQQNYRHWDGREKGAYRRYWEERHEQYRDYGRLNEEQRRGYWEWRDHHPDNDRHRAH